MIKNGRQTLFVSVARFSVYLPLFSDCADGGFEVSEAASTDDAVVLCAVLKQYHCRHRLDAIGHSQLLVVVNIDFDDSHFVAKFLLQLFKDWVHHLARSAPSGEEIN